MTVPAALALTGLAAALWCGEGREAVGFALTAVGGGAGPAAVFAAPLNALFEAASALRTVGLSVGVPGPDLAAPGRLALVALMWLGRLEVAAVLALFVRRGPPRPSGPGRRGPPAP